MAYISKRTGKEVDELLDKVEGNSDNNYTNADKALVQTIPNKVDKIEGKRLSTNDFTDEYKQKVDEFTIDKELSPTSDNAIANSAVVQGLAGLAEGVSDAIGNVSEQLGAKIETKANKDEYYPDMSVGMADNLVGRGDVQDAHINFRPSAGADNITDGAARIERIKGNSVVWNQLAKNADFRNGTTDWGKNNTQLSIVDGKLRIENLTGSSQGVTQDTSIPSKHKILLHCQFTRSNIKASVCTLYLRRKNISGYDIMRSDSISSTDTQNVFLTIDTTDEINCILVYPFIYGEIGSYVDVDFIKIIDLTKMFGAGNEPTTVEEYHQRKPMNIEDEFADNAGTLVDMKVDRLVSVSDNAYDYTKGYARIMGGYKYDITANAGATLVVSFYADGEDSNEEREIAPDSEGKYTFPANGICYVNGDFASRSDICVCLNHSYDKPHPAYQQEVKDLSFIGEVFPEGMRSAGSVFDEIRFNPTEKVWEKVERVGVRAYAEGDAEDSSVITDGTTTNYPLDNPTPTTIDLSPNFNLDYFAWDFGTEEAIASVPSAPFRADIQYGDNFVDDIRKNKDDIATNKANIAKNTSALNSKQNTLTLTTKPNGNIVIGNLAGQTKEFMPATPSGDPMHYTYEAVGAVYNDTGADTTFVGVYGDTILHKANHWRLNDLGDLTNEDMLTIYTERSPIVSMPFTRTKGRTNLITNFTRFSSHSLPQAFRGSKLEVCCLLMGDDVNEKVNPTDLLYTFADCTLLRDILGILNLTDVTRFTNAFLNCHSLRNVLIYGLPKDISFAQSPLSKESLLYMINNCASNVSFTITLHPDVYAKCIREEDYEGEWWQDIDDAMTDAELTKQTRITLASA